jgi:hypothetical protein
MKGQSVEARQAELLGDLLANVRFQEWLWNRISQLTPFHPIVPPENASGLRMAWLEGRRSVGLEDVGAITNDYPLRYASMMSSAPAWRAQREAKEITK